MSQISPEDNTSLNWAGQICIICKISFVINSTICLSLEATKANGQIPCTLTHAHKFIDYIHTHITHIHTYIDVHTLYVHTHRISCSNAIVHKSLNFVLLKFVYLKEKHLLILMRRRTMSSVMHSRDKDNLNFCQIQCSLSQGMSFNIGSNTF